MNEEKKKSITESYRFDIIDIGIESEEKKKCKRRQWPGKIRQRSCGTN